MVTGAVREWIEKGASSNAVRGSRDTIVVREGDLARLLKTRLWRLELQKTEQGSQSLGTKSGRYGLLLVA